VGLEEKLARENRLHSFFTSGGGEPKEPSAAEYSDSSGISHSLKKISLGGQIPVGTLGGVLVSLFPNIGRGSGGGAGTVFCFLGRPISYQARECPAPVSVAGKAGPLWGRAISLDCGRGGWKEVESPQLRSSPFWWAGPKD